MAYTVFFYKRESIFFGKAGEQGEGGEGFWWRMRLVRVARSIMLNDIVSTVVVAFIFLGAHFNFNKKEGISWIPFSTFSNKKKLA